MMGAFESGLGLLGWVAFGMVLLLAGRGCVSGMEHGVFYLVIVN